MSGINPSFTNILQVIGILYPTFLIWMLVLISIFNLTFLKGITYLGGIMFSFCLYVMVARLFNQKRGNNASLTCNIISYPGMFLSPSFPIMITIFSLTYLVIPMIETGSINPAVIAVMSILSLINIYSQYYNNCTNPFGVILSIILGILCGFVWFIIFWTSNKKDLLFYNELLSNNVVCNKPSKQTFKCTVYKNGNIISSNVV